MPRNFGDTVRHVEVQRRPPSGGGHETQPWVGVDHDGVTDRRKQGRVVHAVRVEVAVREVDPAFVRPSTDGGELAVRPHEVADDRAVVRAVVGDAVPRRDHVVEPEEVGERLHEVVRRRRREHQETSFTPVLVDDRPCPRLHPVQEQLRGLLRGLVDDRLAPAARDSRGLPGEGHARQGLPDPVEQAVEQVLAGDRPVRDHAGIPQRAR